LRKYFAKKIKVFETAVDALVNRKKKLFVTVEKEISLSTLFDKFDFIYRYFLENRYAYRYQYQYVSPVRPGRFEGQFQDHGHRHATAWHG